MTPSVVFNSPPVNCRIIVRGPENTVSPPTTQAHSSNPPIPIEDGQTLMPGSSSHLLRRRRSHLAKWIEDQQYIAHTDDNVFGASDHTEESVITTVGTPPNAYLAYPHLKMPSFKEPLDEVGSMHNYVVVDDVDGDADVDEDRMTVDSEGAEHMSPPTFPMATDYLPQPSKSRGSLRNFHLSFRSTRAPTLSIDGSSNSRNSSRLSIFRSRSPPHLSTSTARGMEYRHTKSSSLSTLNLSSRPLSSRPNTPKDSSRPGSSQNPGWKWRPSVLGHFSTPSVPQVSTLSVEHELPRPSVSSAYSGYSSAHTPVRYGSSEAPSTPQKTVLLNTIRSRARSPKRPIFNNVSGTTSVPSLWSGPTSPSHTPETSGRESSPGLIHKESAMHIPFSLKGKQTQVSPGSEEEEHETSRPNEPARTPHVVYQGGKAPRMSLTALSAPISEKRKKKLIVGGIGMNDTRRFEAMKRWCQSFGEVTQIMRMPNGDLHVHFRKAEVAETV